MSATHTVPSAATAIAERLGEATGRARRVRPAVGDDAGQVAVLRDPLHAVAAALDDPHVAVARVDRDRGGIAELALAAAAGGCLEAGADARPGVDGAVGAQDLDAVGAGVGDDDVAVGLDRDVARLHERAGPAPVEAPAAHVRAVDAELGDLVERGVRGEHAACTSAAGATAMPRTLFKLPGTERRRRRSCSRTPACPRRSRATRWFWLSATNSRPARSTPAS